MVAVGGSLVLRARSPLVVQEELLAPAILLRPECRELAVLYGSTTNVFRAGAIGGSSYVRAVARVLELFSAVELLPVASMLETTEVAVAEQEFDGAATKSYWW